jgi:ABC-2 type transport system permease protein
MRTKGWQKVFSFTFVQFIRTKSFIVGTIIVCLITVLLVGGINILPKVLSDDEESVDGGADGNIADFSEVYIIDDAEMLTEDDFSTVSAVGIPLSQTDKTADELIDSLSQSEQREALVRISADSSDGEILGYRVKTYYSPVSDSDAVDALTSVMSELVNYRNMLNAGITAESYAMSQRYVSTSKIEAGSDEWSIFESAINYIVPIVVSLVLFMLIFVYGQTVAQSIATEKTSRVMELLLTSVRPLAVVIGKVLAMGLVSILQFLLIIFVSLVSFLATSPIGIGGDIMEIMQNPEIQQISENAEIADAVEKSFGSFNAVSVLLIFVIFVLGFLFFALIAALVGASISRMEDLQQAMQPYALLGVLGLYLAYFPVMFNADSIETGAAVTNPVQIFSYYFPISSPFALPSALLLGTMSTLQAVIAVLILAVFVVLIAIVVGKVYEGIILHNGNRIKFGDILKMAVRK